MRHGLAEAPAHPEPRPRPSFPARHPIPTTGALTRLPGAQPTTRPTPESEVTVVKALVEHLAALGVEQAFGVSGGAIALVFDALADSSIRLRHFRHESGAAFAATEASLATGKPVAVFATTGPGLMNSLTGITAARWDGAKVILLSGATSPPQRGRWATQETSAYSLPQDALYAKGPLFDFAVRAEQASELPAIARRLSLGVARPGGFVAHVALPMAVQASRVQPLVVDPVTLAPSSITPEDAAWCAEVLKTEGFAIWVGYGATHAAPLVRDFVERSGARVFCSPRAKGIVPETHPQFVGVTGIGGHEAVTESMVQQKPEWVLVLGSRLGESTSFWDRDLLPRRSFLHVDLDPSVAGCAYPDFPTVVVQAEIGAFLTALLPHFPARMRPAAPLATRQGDHPIPMRIAGRGPVRPQVLMHALQRRVVQGSDAVVLAECGNAFAWCNHYLRFPGPGRYRVSSHFGSMGHVAAGVVGAAMGRRGKAVAVVGDGSMLMNSEISTAAQYDTPAVWIVLNDAGYGMCRDGHRALGLTSEEVAIPRVDFVAVARALGADGIRVETEDMVDVALEQAMAASGPFVVDVTIDPDEPSPLLRRFESLIRQGNSKNVAGWDR